MKACLDAIRKYFDVRNEAWLNGHASLRDFLSARRQRVLEDSVTAAIDLKRRAVDVGNTPLVRTHTKIKAQPLPRDPQGKAEDRIYLVREHVAWVYQEGLHYRTEARIIWHRQRWRLESDNWCLAEAWESDEISLTPPRLTELVERDVIPGSVPERGVECARYDRFRAFRYAELWWNGWNPNFPRLRDDCTNFISQCLLAGKVPMKQKSSRAEGWWVETGSAPEAERWSYSWAVTEVFRQYLLRSLSVKTVRKPEELKIGDVIVYDWDGTGHVHHATVVTDFDDHGDPLVNAHTNPSYHRHYRYLDSRAWTPRTRYQFLHVPDNLC